MQHAAAAPIICKEVLDRIDVVVFVRVLLHIPAVPAAEHNIPQAEPKGHCRREQTATDVDAELSKLGQKFHCAVRSKSA